MTSPERLVARLVTEGLLEPLPDGWEFQRVRAGRLQREAGAWSWCIVLDGKDLLASYWSVRDLLAEAELSVRKTRYDPCPIVDPA